MKIEICEQVAQSWLRHIKKCQIAQTNWSISPLELEGYTTTLQYAQAKLFVEQVQQEIRSHSFIKDGNDILKTTLEEIKKRNLHLVVAP